MTGLSLITDQVTHSRTIPTYSTHTLLTTYTTLLTYYTSYVNITHVLVKQVQSKPQTPCRETGLTQLASKCLGSNKVLVHQSKDVN